MARPRIELNWTEIDKLCALQCTQEEIAQFCECSVDTLERASQREHEMSFAEYFEEKRGKGKIALRRQQWQVAMKGNVSMLIWLGKQYLNQKDKIEEEHIGDPKEAGLAMKPTDLVSLIDQARGVKKEEKDGEGTKTEGS